MAMRQDQEQTFAKAAAEIKDMDDKDPTKQKWLNMISSIGISQQKQFSEAYFAFTTIRDTLQGDEQIKFLSLSANFLRFGQLPTKEKLHEFEMQAQGQAPAIKEHKVSSVDKNTISQISKLLTQSNKKLLELLIPDQAEQIHESYVAFLNAKKKEDFDAALQQANFIKSYAEQGIRILNTFPGKSLLEYASDPTIKRFQEAGVEWSLKGSRETLTKLITSISNLASPSIHTEKKAKSHQRTSFEELQRASAQTRVAPDSRVVSSREHDFSARDDRRVAPEVSETSPLLGGSANSPVEQKENKADVGILKKAAGVFLDHQFVKIKKGIAKYPSLRAKLEIEKRALTSEQSEDVAVMNLMKKYADGKIEDFKRAKVFGTSADEDMATWVDSYYRTQEFKEKLATPHINDAMSFYSENKDVMAKGTSAFTSGLAKATFIRICDEQFGFTPRSAATKQSTTQSDEPPRKRSLGQ